ncbi:Iron-sulfur clusters transporter atm1, mitochondrial, partial [Spiromyces aspiralis]
MASLRLPVTRQLPINLLQHCQYYSTKAGQDKQPSTNIPPTEPQPTYSPPGLAPVTRELKEKGLSFTDTQSTGRWSLPLARNILKYVWPKGDWATKSRVVAALTLMAISKVLNVQVPIVFKEIIDGLNIDIAALGGVLPTVSVAMIIGYGAARF